MEIQFKTRNPKQLEAVQSWLDDTTEELLYGGAKYGGKTYLGCSLIFGDALIYPETSYFIARQTLADLRKFTIPSIHERFQHWDLPIDEYAKFNGQDNIFNLYNGSKVYLLECKENPSDPLFERFGSMQMTRGWIEEGGEVAAAAKANLSLSIGRWKNDIYKLKKKLLITANPKKNWMKTEFVKPFQEGTLPLSKKYIQAFATDNVHGNKDYVESLRNEKDPVRRQRLWLGDWDYETDQNALMDFDTINDLFTNSIDGGTDKWCVVDVARYGSDRTVISLWKGLDWYDVKILEQTGLDQVAQEVKEILGREKIPFSHCLIDEDGVGGGVVDMLRGVKGFMANRQCFHNQITGKPENYKNLKTQCAYLLADQVNNHKLKISWQDMTIRESLIEELEQIKRKDPDKEGKLEIEPKDKVKEILGRSPDLADVMIMRMFFEYTHPTKPSTILDPVTILLNKPIGNGQTTITTYE